MKAQRLWRSSLLVAGLLSAGAIAACSGPSGQTTWITPGSTGSSSSGANGAANSGSGSSSGGDAGGSPAVAGAPVPESAGTLVMRRLTYREYDHMVAQLLGDTTSPASG